jgi:hypothetical protein
MTKMLYAILSKIAPVLCLVFIFSPKITLLLQGAFGVNTAANFLWTITIVGGVTLIHCATAFDYWFEQTPKILHYAALIWGSVLAVAVGVGLLMEMTGSTVYFYRYLRYTYVLIGLQVLTGFLIVAQFFIGQATQEELNAVARKHGVNC